MGVTKAIVSIRINCMSEDSLIVILRGCDFNMLITACV